MIAPSARAQTARDYTIEVTATTGSSSPYVTLGWPSKAYMNGTTTIYVRPKGDPNASWGTAITLTGSPSSYADTNAQPGVAYEYSLVSGSCYGAIVAGSNIPLVEQRGNVILLVDNTMSIPLASEITRLQQNLAADGWVVYRHDVPRQTVDPATTGTAVAPARLAELQSVRTIVQNDYNSAPTQNWALMILGHVPVPYSGTGSFDGHGEHAGAWPTDLYYADVDGTWTDTSVNTTGAGDTRNYNIPGDGKFDPNTSSPTVKLETGRVDLANINNVPTGMTETQLLRQYLVRDHRFRRNIAPYDNVARRGIVDPGFGTAFADFGWRDGFGMFGRSVGQMDESAFFPILQTIPMLFAYGCGGGSFTSASGVGDSLNDYGKKDAKAVFDIQFGSYFGDWDCADNFLRAPLAGTPNSLGLCDSWGGNFLYHMALGETIGYGTRFGQNYIQGSGGWVPFGYSNHGSAVSINLMGDPTLRLHSVTPPSRVTATSSSGGIALAWSASPDAAVSGYHIYRSTSASGPFTRVTGTTADAANFTGSPLGNTTLTYTDTDPSLVAGTAYTYLVKAVKIETSASGTYGNQSVGEAVTLTHLAAAPAPIAPTRLSVSRTANTTCVLTWDDNATDETGYLIERCDPTTGAWSQIQSIAANSTTTGDTNSPAGQTVYYRVRASGAPNSAYSNEAADYGLPGQVAGDASFFVVDKAAGTFAPTASRLNGTAGDIGVNYATSDFLSAAGTDYTATTGTLTWLNGQSGSRSASIPISNLAGPQPTKIVKVTYSNPTNGSAIGNPAYTYGFITDSVARVLPSPWATTTFGAMTPGLEGYAEQANGTFGIAGLGAAMSPNSGTDNARFLYVPVTGDCQLTARLACLPLTLNNNNIIAGMMIRGGLDAGAVRDALIQQQWISAVRYTRSSVGGGANAAFIDTPVNWSPYVGPIWMRLTRMGNTVSISKSSDGVNWTLASADVSLPNLPSTVYIGFVLSSANRGIIPVGSLNYARFDNVTFLDHLPIPATPAGLGVGTTTGTTVPLTWTAVPYAAGYRIDRRGEGDTWVQIADTSTTSYSDTTAQADTAYEYRIRAYNSSGESASTAFVCAATLPLNPASVLITTVLTTDVGGADAGVQIDSPGTTYGTDTTLPISNSSAYFTGDYTSHLTKAWLRFNLGATSTSLVSAKLKLAYVGSPNLQDLLAAGRRFGMYIALLAESSDAWDESTINWTNAPQNNTTNTGVLGTWQQLASYYQSSVSTVPAVNSVAEIALTVDSINANRGANNLVTLAIFPALYNYGAIVTWASREHATLPPPTLEVTTTLYQPTRPGFLTVTPGSGSNLNLAWSDSASNESGFQIQRRAANGAWAVVAPLPANTTSYTDTTALPGVIYEYRVGTINAAGNSTWATTTSLQHTTAATVNTPIWSSDSVVFNQADTPSANAYVPTGFTYSPGPLPFVTGQTLSLTNSNTFQGWVGMKFTVGATPITIRELGRWVVSGNTGTHTVKLVVASTSTDVPGGSATVATLGAPSGQFKYVTLGSPVTLAANTVYYLVSQETNGGDQWNQGDGTLTYTNAVATVTNAVYSPTGTSAYTISYGPNNTYGPMAFTYSFGSADTLPFTTGHTMTLLRNDYSGWLGMKLTIGDSDIFTNQLGRWVVSGNTGTHTVKLVDATTGTDLASASVATLGAPAGQFKYVTLGSPVTLTANTSYYLLSQETAGGDRWYDFSTSAAGSATGYQSWLLANGLPMDASGSGSASATPANDGLPNLIKYALGLNPGVNGNGGRLSYGQVTDTGNDYLSLTYTRPEPASGGITYTVEASSDLASWNTTGLVQVSNTANAGLRTITVRDASPLSGNSKRFMRLKVTQP